MTLDIAGMKIAVLMGGPGSERKVSLKSGEGVVSALRELGADVIPVDVTGTDFALPDGTQVAFNVIHGTFGEDGQVQRILESRGIPYTGENVAGSELAIDKIATKKRLLARNVPTPKFEILAENNFDDYTLSSPAVSEGQIFIRTTSALWAIGKRK